MSIGNPLQKLVAGQSAPAIATEDVLGTPFELSQSPHRFVLLAFMRFATCPWCNLAIHRLALEYPTFLEHDCEIVAFMQSDAASIRKNIYDRHAVRPEFPLIADQAAVFYEQYGVKESVMAAMRSITKIPAWVNAVKDHGFSQHSLDGKKFLVPAYFLVDTRNNKIVSADYDKSFYDHETFIQLYEDVIFKGY